jgi:hypothetical protein
VSCMRVLTDVGPTTNQNVLQPTTRGPAAVSTAACLQKAICAERSGSRCWPAAVRARCFVQGRDKVAASMGTGTSWIC